MDYTDMKAIFQLCQGARDRFPEAWRVFFMEFSEPVEARREAFATLVGYVNSHLLTRAPGVPTQTPIERQNLICTALASFLGPKELTQDFMARCMADLTPVEERFEPGPITLLGDAYSLASLPPPAPQPRGRATLEPNGLITVDCDLQGHWAYESMVNYGDDNTWELMSITTQAKWIKNSGPAAFLEGEQPATPPLMWRYRVRYREKLNAEGTWSRPVGLWSEEIPVRRVETAYR